MKSKYIFILIIFLFSHLTFADVCSDLLSNLNDDSFALTSKKIVTYDELKIFKLTYLTFQASVKSENCNPSIFLNSKSLIDSLKSKRIETINKFMALKITEESGNDLALELAILSGKKSNVTYELEDLFGAVPLNKNDKDSLKLPIKKSKNDDVLIVNQDKTNPIRSSNSCTDKINQNESVNLENARNQDGVGWCYAYVAADLLSYRLGKKISAVSLYNSKQSIEADIQHATGLGGNIEEAIETYLKNNNSLCLEEDLPSSDFKFCTYNNYAKFLNSLYQSAQKKSLKINQCLADNINSLFPGIEISTISNYVQKNGAKDLAEYLNHFQCKKQSFSGYKTTPVALQETRNSKEEMISTIDEKLNKSDVVGFYYDYKKLDSDNVLTGSHASIIVGRRFNNQSGSCEYLVRNSWGKDCIQKEGTGLTCHKNCDSQGDNCRYSGHYWVGQERLKNAMTGVAYLP